MDGIREEELYKIEQKKPHGARRRYENILQQVRQDLRVGDSWKSPCTAAELESLDLRAWSGRRAYKSLMPLFMNCPTDPLAKQAFLAVASTLAEVWGDKEDKRGQRDLHFEGDCEAYLSRFMLTLPLAEAVRILEPVLNSVDKAPREVTDLVKQLIYSADATGVAAPFWLLWEELAARCLNAPWLRRLEDRHSRDEGLLRAMFLNIHWKVGITHWPGLAGEANHIDEFFSKLPAVPVVFSAYTAFLFEVGERSLPKAFRVLANRLKAGHAGRI